MSYSQSDNILISCHLVLDATFSHLSAKSLHCAAQVCRSWECAVKRQFKKRCWFEAGLIHLGNGENETSRSFNRKDASRLFFNELRQEPSLVLALTSSSTYDNDDAAWKIDENIPRNCSLLTAGVGGVVGREWTKKHASKNLTGGIHREMEYMDATSMLCLNLSSNLDFKNFFIPCKQVSKMIKGNVRVSDLTGASASLIEDSNSVVLLLATSFTKTNKLIQRLKDSNEGKRLIVIGGYTDYVRDSMNRNISKGIMGMWFHGENLCASLFVHSSTSTENLISGLNGMKEDIMKKSGRVLNWDKCLMLTVMCVERGAACYGGKPNVESDLVEEIFPGITIFGFFGYGEIGFDSERLSRRKKCNFEQTSIFCLLSYGW